MKDQISGFVLVIVVFSILLLSILALILASIESTYLFSGISYRSRAQVQFVSDAGLERAKELTVDSGGSWRPWKPCPERCNPVCHKTFCPPECTSPCDYSKCKDCYLREYMTVGGKKSHYDIYVIELAAGIKLLVEAKMDE
jgi:hypothetical protein